MSQLIFYSFAWQQHVLYPDNAAVIIIKMELRDFEMHPSGCDYEIFAIYEVFTETGTWKELHTHLATVRIDSDIFHDKRFQIDFDSDRSKKWNELWNSQKILFFCVMKITKKKIFSVFRDLLAIIATSERQMFRIELADDVSLSQLHDFLFRRLSFDNIPTTLSINDVNIVSNFIYFYILFLLYFCSFIFFNIVPNCQLSQHDL